MAKETGGHAFPLIGMGSRAGQSFDQIYEGGMTLRDYFAAKAMQGICAHPDTWGLMAPGIAAHAYEIADAMLAERDK